MTFGVLISNNVGSRKGVPVFDSRNPDTGMLQPIRTIETVAGTAGSQTINPPAGAKTVTSFDIALYPTSAARGIPNVYVSDSTVYWNYVEVADPTAVIIVVFT